MNNTLPTCLYTAQQVKQGEQEAARLAGIEMYQLMLAAGEASYNLVRRQFPQAKNLLVLCGKGNNGGDGFVIARLAKQDRLKVTVALHDQPDQLQGDALKAKDDWLASGGQIHSLSELDWSQVTCDVIIDALLGTGLTGEVKEPLRSVVDQVNQLSAPVLAVDIPSGLCSNTGKVLGAAIEAAHTLTFIGVKQGLMTGQARGYTGQLHYSGLGVESEFEQTQSPSAVVIDSALVRPWLPIRYAAAHKGMHGRLLCLGGNQGYAGAIRLCAGAAVNTGAGLVRALCHSSSILPLQVSTPEVMTQACAEQQALVEGLDWAQVLAFGPGLGTDEWAQQLFHTCITRDLAKVVDADGLNLLAKNPSHDDKRVITPHPGEAARLLGCSVAQIESDRFAAIVALQRQYGGVVVLKGAGSLVFDGKQMYVCPAGNPGMASGGIGDVLTGIIGALLAQGLSYAHAAIVGVYLHSCAADELARDQGLIGMRASEVSEQSRRVLNQWVAAARLVN
ncbi:NAD(P)H-hydrate dehydratase [Vibrio sp. JPW-9-11-11]|uniref:NAD(P)H-hydrate dehydratase n=1 Tax=Vibrio sp. JPW-9-11-11 TaxID=1416532 RepID=UPI001593FBEC|nr:NAD(P)H-hydrate dehydratase [Vibrio sp. JPW-9-11-11]NVD08394.1 NAD(P)H-hydrate dehydratase [Vibrio sp. JPW-9-11-11]